MNYPSENKTSYSSYERAESSGTATEASRLLSGLSKTDIDKIVNGDIYLLCIDFGHGESTIARMQIKDDVSGERVCKVVPLNTNATSPAYKHETYIFVPKDREKERISIGKTAHNRANSGVKGDFYCYFKKMPHQAGNYAEPSGGRGVVGERVTYAYLMKAYLQAYLDMMSTDEILKSNGMNSNKQVILMIGRPSGNKWDKAEAAYKQLFEGLKVFGKEPVSIHVLSESFAALAQSVNDSESIEYKHEETVVCVDMGSSTADITCMCRGSVVYEYGISLGAHMIESNLLDYVISEANRKFDREDNPFTLKDIDGYPMPEFRVYKENYFGDSTKEPLCNEKMRLDLDDGVDCESVAVRLSEKVMDTVCKNTPIRFNDKNAPEGKAVYNSWYDACKTFYEKARTDIYKKIDNGQIPPIKVIVLTGGASRMSFVKELVESVFGDPKEIGRHNHRAFLIYQSREPSYTVSKGLAWISYNAAKTEQILESVKRELPSLLKNETDLPMLYYTVAKEIAPTFYDICHKEMCLWSKRTRNESLNQVLRNFVNPKCNSQIATANIRARISSAIIDWYNKGGVNVQSVMDSITDSFSEMFGVSLRGMNLPLPKDAATKAAESVSGAKITLDALPLIKNAIAILPIFGFFYNLDRVDHPSEKREQFAARFGSRQHGTEAALTNEIANQLLGYGQLDKYIMKSLEHDIDAIIDSKINDISMYCFKARNQNQ